MSVSIGRAVLNDLYDLRVSGRRVSFKVDIEGSDQYGLQALRQQLAGLVDNRDEEVVPFTWSEDSSLDGFYRVVSVDVPSTDVQLVNGYAPGVTVELEQLAGSGNPWFETTVTQPMRTNSHGVTFVTGRPAMGVLTTDTSFDWGDFAGLGSTWLTTDDGSTLVSAAQTAPLSGVRSYRFAGVPASHYYASCRIEVKYGSTWYPVMGRQIPRRNVWRINNGHIRLTSANGATSGTLETYDVAGASWESQNITHYIARAIGQGIGLGDGSTQPYVSIVRNSPEAVAVQVTGPSDVAKANHITVTYLLMRGHRHVAVSWSSSESLAFGVAMTSSTAMTLAAALGGAFLKGPALYQTTAVAGNVAVFSSPLAFSSDTVNGRIAASPAATAGQHMIGVYQGAPDATSARTLVDEYLAGTSWASRVIVR